MNRTSTRALVESAFLTAINTVLTLLGYTVPLFSLLIPFAMPAGVAIIALRNGLRATLLSVLVMFIIVSMTLGPQVAFISAATFGLLGAAVGQGYRKRWSAAKHVCLPAILFLIMNFLGMLLSVLVMGMNVTQVLDVALAPLEEVNRMMIESAHDPVALAEWQHMWAVMQTLAKQAFFSILFVSSAVSTFVVMKVTQFIYKRTVHIELQQLPSFEDWRMPNWSAYIFLVGLIANYWLTQWGFSDWSWISYHLMILGMLFCVLNGLSTLFFIAVSYGVGRKISYLLVILAYFILALGVVVIGIADMMFDLRRRIKERL